MKTASFALFILLNFIQFNASAAEYFTCTNATNGIYSATIPVSCLLVTNSYAELSNTDATQKHFFGSIAEDKPLKATYQSACINANQQDQAPCQRQVLTIEKSMLKKGRGMIKLVDPTRNQGEPVFMHCEREQQF